MKTTLFSYRNYLVRELSGGNQRKLLVAVALLGAPRMLLLDEPTAGIDPVSRREMWDLLQQFCNFSSGTSAPSGAGASGGEDGDSRAIFLTSHLVEEAELLCSQVAVQREGRWRCLGRESPGKVWVFRGRSGV